MSSTLMIRKPRAVAPPAGTSRRRSRVGGVASVILLWTYALAALAPLVIMAFNSLRTEQDLANKPLGLPLHPAFQNYAHAWSEGNFSTYFLNSVVITVSSVLLGTGVSVFAAYPLGRYRFRGRGALSSYFLAGLMLPIRLGAVPVFYLVNSLTQALPGVDGRFWLICVYAGSGVPFSVFVLTAFFRQLPMELEEAARIDGAGELRIFARIMVPMVRPALTTVALFQFIPLWNDFFFPLVLLKDDQYTLPTGLTRFFAEFEAAHAQLSAGLVITTIPLVVLFLVATKQIVAGLTAGMTK
ncbi:carbohydrate ABC transporter permease [Actinoallomurus purpureus]|uniref:carbohydrate ABC transporter permease n=1 Tax=Actinoallomurus purpureus TaxID=478114 RepID=UPI002092A938|nr:carbohydrate ABC transporter permease [Actinoallomurus purpureus]MCO6005938.1 carbohydrate ABC transporter permease [Actinoallomurus purpureus]